MASMSQSGDDSHLQHTTEEWLPQELMALQTTARLTQIPLSELVRRAETSLATGTQGTPLLESRQNGVSASIDTGHSPEALFERSQSTSWTDGEEICQQKFPHSDSQTQPQAPDDRDHIVAAPQAVPNAISLFEFDSSPPNTSRSMETGLPPTDRPVSSRPADDFCIYNADYLGSLAGPLADDEMRTLAGVILQENDPSTSIPQGQRSISREVESGSGQESSGTLAVNNLVELDLRGVWKRYLRSRSSNTSKAHQMSSSRVNETRMTTSRRIESLQLVRKCVACKMSHKRCEPSGIPGLCSRCMNRKYSMCNLPCVYFELSDTVLFRTMTDPISLKPYTALGITNMVSGPIDERKVAEVKTIELTQGYGTALTLSVRRFDTSALYINGASEAAKSMYSHPYALSDLGLAEEDIKKFIQHSIVPYITAKVDRSDVLTLNLFKAAGFYANGNHSNSSLVSNVLYLWTAARTIEGNWRFQGTETLGLSPNECGIIPLVSSPFIDYQFSGVMVQQVLLPLRQKVLKKLLELTDSHTADNFFCIFLVNFILLHTYGLLMNQQRKFARERKASVRYTLMPLVREIHTGAKTLLDRFHRICKGREPFKYDWGSGNVPKQVQRMFNLTGPQQKFLGSVRGLVREKMPTFISLARTHDYEANYWFPGQLFIPDWKPLDTLEHSPPA